MFQGLGDDEEEVAEQYDEAVMIRVGIESPEELASGFPKTPDELFWFDALVLDDIEPKFFSRDQLAMIRRFVSGRGGGLLMLGGQEMFSGKAFADSTLGELAPVYVKRGAEADEGPFILGLTREGMLQPWLRLRDSANDETTRLRRMPAFASVNRVGDLKAGAYQFASVTDPDGEPRPAVVVQRFGRGKVGAITITDLWRWSMRRDPDHADDAAQAWRQTARWLVSDVPQRAEVLAADSDDDRRSRSKSVLTLTTKSMCLWTVPKYKSRWRGRKGNRLPWTPNRSEKFPARTRCLTSETCPDSISRPLRSGPKTGN